MEKKLTSIETVDYLKVNFKKLLESLKEDEILKKAFYDLVEKNESANLPYHGNAHSLSVGLLMYQTFCSVSERNRKVASLAGLFHDFNHTGKPDSQSDNLNIAIQNMRKFCPEDLADDIESVIRSTEYPYKNSPAFVGEDLSNSINLMKLAIRLCDLSWQNIFPIDVASLGIHKEQYSDSSYEEIELGSRDFREKEISKFISLEDNCPAPLKGLYNLFKQS